MQGVPGSGKSTYVRLLSDRLKAETLSTDEDWATVSIRSTDDYRYGECGHYFHDVEQNALFHRKTQQDAADDMRNGVNYVVVDNTNIERWQAEPYIMLAKIYDYDVDVIRIDPGLAVAKKRNATRSIERRVPDHVIEDMHSRMEGLL